MPNSRLVIANKLEVVGCAKIRKYDGILFIGKSRQGPLAMEPNENPVVKRRRETRRRKGDIVCAFAFGTGEWIGLRFKGKKRLDATPADQPTSPVLNVIRRVSEVGDRART